MTYDSISPSYQQVHDRAADYFAKSPRTVGRDKALSASDHRVYQVIALRVGTRGWFYDNLKTIAAEARVSERQARRSSLKLSTAGHVVRIRLAKKFGTVYRYSLPEAEGTISRTNVRPANPGPSRPARVGRSRTIETSTETVDNETSALPARTMIYSTPKARYHAFLSSLSKAQDEGILSPVDNPESYARTCAKRGSSPPEDVDVDLLIAVTRTLKRSLGIPVLRLPQIGVMQETCSWYARLRRFLGTDFLPYLTWAVAQAKISGTTSDPRHLVHGLTQAGLLPQVHVYRSTVQDNHSVNSS